LTRDAVVAAETVIIDYLIRSASIDTEMNTVMPPNSPNSGHRVQPIHIQMSGAGDLAVMAVGERQDGWVFKAQRSDAEVHLRRGFRCRKTFKRQAGPVLQGRCFEWVIVEDSSPLRPGLPKFVMHELSLDENIGTLSRSAHKFTSHSPTEMWNAMVKHPEGGNNPMGTNDGVRLCGFNNTAILQLLLAADEADRVAEEEALEQCQSLTSAESLTSAASRQAIIEFELQFMKSHSQTRLLPRQLRCKECNAVIAVADSLYPKKEQCKDTEACNMRKLNGFNQPDGGARRSSRRR